MTFHSSKYILVSFVFLFLISCVKQSNWDRQINWERLDINSLPTQKDYPDYGAIVLHDEAKIETFGDEEDGWSYYSRHRIVKIFDIKGHQYANLAIPYSPGNEIEQLQARTISPQGKITVVSPENIYDISLYPNFMLYSDQRSRLFTFPAIENGSVIEYQYSVRYNGHTFGNSWTFQDNIPVLYSKFEISIPSEAEPVYKLSFIDVEPKIKKAPKGFKSKYTWEAKDLVAIEPEIGMPVRKHAIARLNISSNSMKSWDEVGDWYRNLSSPQMTTSEKLKNIVSELTKNKVENTDKLKAIFNWVNENIRYISVSIGIGSYQPHAASQIFENRYGDCKDMTNLLCSMAKEAEIDVFPAIISTWQNGNVDTSIVSVGHFNHVIAYYQINANEGIWMDATDKACGFDALPWYDQGRLVLAVLEDSSKFIRTPQLNYLSNRKKTDWEVDLAEDGSAVVHGVERVWGAQANDRRYELMMISEKDKKKWIENGIAEQCAFTKLDSFSISNDISMRDPLIIRYVFSSEKFADKILGDLVFRPGKISNMNLADYFTEEERTYPIRFKYGMQQQLSLEIKLPENWLVKTNEVDETVKSDFGEAIWRWNVKGTNLSIQNQFILKGENIPPEKYPQFKSFLKKVRLQEMENILIAKTK